MFKRLVMFFLEKYNILYKHQYGFRAKYSIIHPILQLLKYIAEANDNKRSYTGCGLLITYQIVSNTMRYTNVNYLKKNIINGLPQGYF